MFHLSCEWAAIIQTFAPLFSPRVWVHAQALLLGAIVAPGKRTVSSVLRALGLSDSPHFQRFHRVLNRDSWSPRQAGRLLLGQLIQALNPSGPLVFGLDDTIERRRGQRIRERGIYRDAARSSKKVLNKTSGLRWLSAQLLTVVPFAGRVWGLPFLTLLAPSERCHKERGRPHRPLTRVAKDAMALVKRWAPKRSLIFVGDSSYAALDLLAWSQRLKAALIVPLRLDANLFHPAPPRKPGQKGRPAKKGKPQPKLKERITSKRTRWRVRWVQWYGKGKIQVQLASGTAVWYHQRSGAVPIRWMIARDPLGRFETRALACSRLDLDPWQILEHYTRRWQMEVTFQEARAHLGFETQRQWKGLAIRRATPALLGLFSVVTLLAHSAASGLQARRAAWYQKRGLTFSDALAHVRARLWQSHFCASQARADAQKIPQAFLQRFADLICYAQ